jgi:hypothetical protein
LLLFHRLALPPTRHALMVRHAATNLTRIMFGAEEL